jgi:hypothetical protein
MWLEQTQDTRHKIQDGTGCLLSVAGGSLIVVRCSLFVNHIINSRINNSTIQQFNNSI